MNMLGPLASISCMALLLAACGPSPPVQAVSAPPQPAMVQAPSFMVFFDWDRSNLSAQALATIQQAAAAYKSNSGARVTAVGHTDTSGPTTTTWRFRCVARTRSRGARPGRRTSRSDRHDRQGRARPAGRDGRRRARAAEPAGRDPRRRAAGERGDLLDPRAYCKAMTDKWREYRNSQVDTVEAVAISKCEAGDYAAGIPVLEDALITARMPLPAPGYRWPGRSYTPS